MNEEILVERLFQALISGDRTQTRQIIGETYDSGASAEMVACQLLWPAMEMVNTLFRSDQLTTLAHHYAMRQLRSLVDQAQAKYAQQDRFNRRILMFSGQSEADELSGQLAADLLEASGFEVLFAGGGVANDEILGEVGAQRPDVLLMFASGPSDAPNIRLMVDKIRGVDACPEMQIAVGGGVFARAEGLAQEIGADIWAHEPLHLIEELRDYPSQRATAEQRTVGRNRRTGQSAEAA